MWTVCHQLAVIWEGFDFEISAIAMLYLKVASLFFRQRGIFGKLSGVSALSFVMVSHVAAVVAMRTVVSGDPSPRFGLRWIVFMLAILPGLVALLGVGVVAYDVYRLNQELS